MKVSKQRRPRPRATISELTVLFSMMCLSPLLMAHLIYQPVRAPAFQHPIVIYPRTSLPSPPPPPPPPPPSCIQCSPPPNPPPSRPRIRFPSPPPPPPPPAQSPKLQYILALQWGYTVCNQNSICSRINLSRDFTVHGLWMVNQPKVKYCWGFPFHRSHLTGLRNWLDQYWVDAIKGNNIKFWRHEYVNHGVCDNSTVEAFFRKVHDEYTKNNFGVNLGMAVKSHYSSLRSMVSERILYASLRRVIGKRFAMICAFDHRTGTHKLREIRIQYVVIANQLTIEDYTEPFAGKCPMGANVLLPLR